MLEESEKVDIVTEDKQGGVQLVITDAGITRNPVDRAALYQAKLTTYARYVGSPKFQQDYPGVSPEQVRVLVVHRTPLEAEVACMTTAALPGGRSLPVEFTQFDPDGTATDSSKTGETPVNGGRGKWGWRKRLVLGLVVALAGFVIWNATRDYLNSRRLAAEGVAAVGRVTHLEKYYERRVGTKYRVTAEWQTAGGQGGAATNRRTFRLSPASMEQLGLQEGGPVPIRHLPLQPEVAEVVGGSEHDSKNWLTMGIFVGMALLFYVLRSRSAPQSS